MQSEDVLGGTTIGRYSWTALGLVLLATGAMAGERDVLFNDGGNWPTLHGDPVRSGRYPHFPGGPLQIAWRKELHRELTGPRAEVIVGGSLAYLGSYAGKMYAWDAETGEERWCFQTRGPIGHSPAWHDGVLYFGSMDRHLYAVQATDGQVLWKFEADEGFWSSPAVFDGLVYVGDRAGVFHAIHAVDGAPAWQHPTGDRILTPASLSPDGTRVIFASEDMRVYSLEAKSGKLLWQSRKLHGLSLRDHAPTIVGGLAILTTNPARNFHDTLDAQQQFLLLRTGFRGSDQRYIPGSQEDVRREQDAIVQYLKENPSEQTFYAFRLSDGQQPWIAPIFYTAGLHNPPTPPCFNPESGDVFVLVRSAYGTWDGGGEVRPYLAFGDRFIGGENYTSPPHLSRAMFAGAALIERLSGESLFTCLDVPWCRGDFYFIEKCVLALWSNAGQTWQPLR